MLPIVVSATLDYNGMEFSAQFLLVYCHLSSTEKPVRAQLKVMRVQAIVSTVVTTVYPVTKMGVFNAFQDIIRHLLCVCSAWINV